MVAAAVTWVVPAGLVMLWRKARGRSGIWRGAYREWSDVPSRGSGFNADRWISNSSESMERLLEAHEQGVPLPSDTRSIGEHRTLVTLASVVSASRGSVRILDFGGGLGEAFVHLNDALPRGQRMEYHIVEVHAAVRAGRRILSQFSAVRFHESLPDLTDVDIVYANGSLQFARDYRKTLRQLAALRPEFIVLVELPAGTETAFASAQTNLGGAIPVWFFQLREIIAVMADAGFDLMQHSRAQVNYPQDGVPTALRVSDFHTLVLRRREPS
jgi:putative methyltransferase (TIGR04325 family)